MAQAISVELTGFKEAIAKLNGLKRGARGKIIRPAVNAGLQPMKKAVKANMPSGPLKKAIISKVAIGKESGAVVGLVGADKKASAIVLHNGVPVKQVPYKILHLVEGGRKAVKARGKTLSIGGVLAIGRTARAVAGKFALRRGYATSKAAAEAAFAAKFAERIEKFGAA